MQRALTRRAAIATAAATCTAPLWATGTSDLLSPGTMRDDVKLLRRAYETLHPGLLRYQSAAESAARFDALAAATDRSMSRAAFYLLVSRFLATIRCGHSYANFYNQAKAVQADLFDGLPRLPLQFVWLGSRMVVTADPFATGIVPGSEILAIDGRPAGAILAALIPVARADGHNDAKRRQLMSVQGEDGYESFDIFYGLMFGGATRFRLAVADPDGKVRTAFVPAITLADRRKLQIIPDAGRDDGPIWSVERQGRAARLVMNGWGVYNSKWDWRGWIDGQIDRLIADRVPGLIVDIRRNEGGEDCGDTLIARLIDRPLITNPARRLVRYRTLPTDLRPYCDTWDRTFDMLGVGARAYDDRFLELAGEDRGPTVIEPKGVRYAGRVVVLVGPQNSSATFQFAEVMQRERLATLIGQPTGGNRRGINGGCFYFFRLPATGLEVDLPLIGTFPREPQPDAGIIPDIVVPRTARSIMTGADPVLAQALSLA